MSRHLLRKALRLPQAALKRLVTGLLQLVLLANRPARLARSGFVLPTTVLLVLMVVLTATALTYRSFTRSDMAISQREQQVITNAATPAIDRAKAKIEFLFRTDNRFPSGLPNSDLLADLMLVRAPDGNPSAVGYTGRIVRLAGADDPYTLPDEQRVDINGNDRLDNAWSFQTDINGDGVIEAGEIVVYSILVDDEATPENPLATAGPNLRSINSRVDQLKADALVTRTGPLATTEASPACAGALAEGGWQVVQQGDSSSLQKNFQVNAFVANANDVNRTFQTLEFQQSRSAARANKWGAWFRYDLAVTPGPALNWNGAMHTDGSFFSYGPGGANANQAMRSHMISSHRSCLYTQEASEISLAALDLDGDGTATPGQVVDVNGIATQEFQGQAVRGSMITNNTTAGGNPFIHVWNGRNERAITDRRLANDTDSVRTSGTNNDVSPADVAMNPLALFTRDVTEHINPRAWERDPVWDTGNDNFRSRGRIINDEVTRPFVDDFFRADNRWGPKPRYDSRDTSLDMTVAGTSTGLPIANLGKLTDPEGGFDGYWERQAIRSGLRLVVGQRLALGNANGWNSDPITRDAPTAADAAWSEPVSAANGSRNQSDALYPATRLPRSAVNGTGAVNDRYGRSHEYLQRKALRDNLAAAQSMAVYHYRINDGQFPAACVAMAAHPGTPQAIVDSRTFEYYPSTTTVKTDFFNGRGTNGWEYQYPATFDTAAEFRNQVLASAPLGRALRNLAYFAGDPRGGAPSFPPVQDSFIHPHPYLSMWGDFSVLRRIIDPSPNGLNGLSTAAAFDTLSPADKATVHSAACTLTMLARNIKEDNDAFLAGLNAFDGNLQPYATQLGNELRDLVRFVRPDIHTGGAGKWDADWPATKDPRITTPIPGCVEDPAYRTARGKQRCNIDEYLANFTQAELITILRTSRPPGQTEAAFNQTLALIQEAANAYRRVSSLTRDRELGFKPGKPSMKYIPGYTETVAWNQTTGNTGAVQFGNADIAQLKTQCNPNIFQRTATGGGSTAAGFRVALALVVCNEIEDAPVRYPSLFYLFPVQNHGLTGAVADGNDQPATEEFFTENVAAANRYISRADVNGGVTYGIIGALATDGLTWPDAMAAIPRGIAPDTWTIPAGGTTVAITRDNISDQGSAFKIIAPGGGVLRVPFLDKGVYNGREQLNTRVLDIDIEALARNTTSGGDRWLSFDPDRSAEGVVYAFREDAVREDEIVRPVRNPGANPTPTAATCLGTDGTNPVRFNIETVDNCRMSAEPGNATRRDPPLTDLGVSLKPVDFYADPERRTHGFRLRTFSGEPADFSGPAAPGGAPGPRQVGMTFVTDNSIYIQGDFNLHSTTGRVADIVEEFDETLFDGEIGTVFGNAFYNARTNLNLDNFATVARDHWRPVEILADAITITSATFRDGTIEDGFLRNRPTTRQVADSSYMNQNRPNFAQVLSDPTDPTSALVPAGDLPRSAYVRERQDDPDTTEVREDLDSPVWIDRNGTYFRTGLSASPTIRPFYVVYGNNEWTHFTTGDNERRLNLQRASQTYINATFISGLVPERPQQGYGGLHNFVRFLEDWNDAVNLHIAGSFIQLNFSTSSTGPFEHDAWQPGQDPNNNERLGYYQPPVRRWGYDVALLYLPPAPAARRFVNIGAPRSEYYRELPADDPYIVNLRCARDANGALLMDNFCTRA